MFYKAHSQEREKYLIKNRGEEHYKKSLEFFSKNDIENFRIKNWKDDIGAKFHPLLKDSPVLVTNIWREDLLKLDDDIQKIFNNPPVEELFYDDKNRPHKKVFSIPENELGQKILNIIGKDLDIDNEFFMVTLVENQIDIYDIAAEKWHIDHQLKQSVRVIIYLTDVDNEGDAPFEYISNPEKRHYNMDSILDRNLDLAAGFKMQDYANSLPPERKIKVLGPRYTAIVFDPTCIHKGNKTINKPRRILLADIKRKNNIGAYNGGAK
jgi:hypothetical protein